MNIRVQQVATAHSSVHVSLTGQNHPIAGITHSTKFRVSIGSGAISKAWLLLCDEIVRVFEGAKSRGGKQVANVLNTVRAFSKDVLNIKADEVGLYSIQSGAAMTTFLRELSVYLIMGRWFSDALLLYIRKQVEQFSHNVSFKINETMFQQYFFDTGNEATTTTMSSRDKTAQQPKQCRAAKKCWWQCDSSN